MELSLVRKSINNVERTKTAYMFRVDLYTQTYGQVSRHPLWKVCTTLNQCLGSETNVKVKTRLGAIKKHTCMHTHASTC